MSSPRNCKTANGPPMKPLTAHINALRFLGGAKRTPQTMLEPRLAATKANAGTWKISCSPASTDRKSFNKAGVDLPKAKLTPKEAKIQYVRRSKLKSNDSYGSFTNSPSFARRTQDSARPRALPASSNFSGVQSGVCLGPTFRFSKDHQWSFG